MNAIVDSQEFVYVPIPSSMLSQALKWLSDQMPEENVRPDVPLPENRNKPISAETFPLSEWNDPLIKRMVEESPLGMKLVLRCLVQNAGIEVPTRQIAQSMDHKPNADSLTVAGTLGAFARRVKNRYAQETWPFENRWDHEQQCYFYKMDPEVAALVKKWLVI